MLTAGNASTRRRGAYRRARPVADRRDDATRSAARDRGCRGCGRRRLRCPQSARGCAGASCRPARGTHARGHRFCRCFRLLRFASYIRVDKYITGQYIRTSIYKETDMDAIKDAIRQKYGAAAETARTGAQANCGCDSTCCDTITSNLYDTEEAAGLPAEAVLASLGCGNPTALADLHPGDVVLDLGSGGGIDVLLSARRVGPAGKAYGLDMTDEMLALARENQKKAGVSNVEFLKGEIEHIPLPDDSVDVIISNCVINLSADKDKVLREAFRVLKPGGRFAVSDVVVRGDVPAALRRSVELWIGCVAGALEEEEYRDKLAKAGFRSTGVEPTRVYRVDDAREFLTAQGIEAEAIAPQVDGKFMSAFVRAVKPGRSCCG